MISDSALYTLAIFLGSAAVLMIVLYHFLEVNAKDGTSLSPNDGAKAVGEKGSVDTGVAAAGTPAGGKKGKR